MAMIAMRGPWFSDRDSHLDAHRSPTRAPKPAAHTPEWGRIIIKLRLDLIDPSGEAGNVAFH